MLRGTQARLHARRNPYALPARSSPRPPFGVRLTWNTFRNHFILEYEIPKYDADLRSPNFFVPLSDAQARKKVNNLMRYFTTQRNKRWFREELFYGLMWLRSTEAASPTPYSEAFYCRKILLAPAD